MGPTYSLADRRRLAKIDDSATRRAAARELAVVHILGTDGRERTATRTQERAIRTATQTILKAVRRWEKDHQE